MDQQDRGPDASPSTDKQAPQAQRAADESANDSSWGVGSASALDQLRRHDFGARRSRTVDPSERPTSE
jgi:hypothetical protein